MMSSLGMEAGGKRYVQGEIDRKELKKAIDQLKCSKAADMDGITAGILRYGGETVVEPCMERDGSTR